MKKTIGSANIRMGIVSTVVRSCFVVVALGFIMLRYRDDVFSPKSGAGFWDMVTGRQVSWSDRLAAEYSKTPR